MNRHYWSNASISLQDALSSVRDQLGEIYLVGGVVRSMFLTKHLRTQPLSLSSLAEIDVAAPHTKEELLRAFSGRCFHPKNQETVVVVFDQIHIEITPFREKGIEEDLKARDFTINALACPVSHQGIDWDHPIDPTGGQRDIFHKVLRVFRPSNFDNDPLRILRLFRFHAQLGFDMDSLTLRHALQRVPLLREISLERIEKEFRKIILAPHAIHTLRIMGATDIIETLMPVLGNALQTCHQDRHHREESVYEHNLRVLGNCPEAFVDRMAAFLHDVGKIGTSSKSSENRYIGHEKASMEIAQSVTQRLRLPKAEIREILRLIQYHMIPVNSERMLKIILMKEGKDFFHRLVRFIYADKSATDPFWTETEAYQSWLTHIRKARRLIRIISANQRWCTGRELITLGLNPNPSFAIILNSLILQTDQSPLDSDTIQVHLEHKLLFRRSYRHMVYTQISSSEPMTEERIVEYWDGRSIVGVLRSQKRLEVQGPIFRYSYHSQQELESLRKERRMWLHYPCHR